MFILKDAETNQVYGTARLRETIAHVVLRRPTVIEETDEELVAYQGKKYKLSEKPVPTEEELLAQAKADRADAVAALTVTVDGMIFDGDETAQERMARAVLMAESPDETTEWVLADNTVALVTADQLRRACRAAGKAQTALWTVPYAS